ncbi:MAG: iron chelate uptake ABC transporter family permease subunit, partial [Porticoccaceae bacterium]
MRYLAAAKLVWCLALLLPAVAIVSLSMGTVSIPLSQIIQTLFASLGDGIENTQTSSIVLDIRLPRIFLALLVGAVLAVLGTVMQ